MEEFDLVIRNGRIATASDKFEADVGVRDEVIVAIAKNLAPGKREIDATDRWVLPGGIDSHCHVEQLSGMGMMCADDFYSATVSAAFGGTTTIIPFAAQHREMKIPEVVADYAKRAREKAVIDYGFHLILANPDDDALNVDLPAAIQDGITSLKVYMTYDKLQLHDHQLLDVMTVAAREQGYPGRGADGVARVGLGEADALACQSVEMGGLDGRITIGADLIEAQIICQDEYDVGLRCCP